MAGGAMRIVIIPALLILLAAVIPACSPSLSPEENYQKAQRLLASDAPQKAFNIYREILDQGKAIPKEIRFRAAFESIRCLVLLGRFDDARNEFTKFDLSFQEEMRWPSSYKYGLIVTNELVRQKADVELILDVINHLKEKFPDMKDNFESYIDALLNRAEGGGGNSLEDLKLIAYL